MRAIKPEVVLNIVILALVYVGGLFLASFFLNYNSQGDTHIIKYESKNLPYMTVGIGDNEYNHLNGYSQEMDIRFVHDALSTVSARSDFIALNIHDFADNNLRIDYIISSFSMDKIYARSELDDIIKENGRLIARVPINTLPDELEAMLHIILYEKGENPVHYYLRLKRGSEKITEEYITYINKFVNGCIDKNKEIAKYIEPDGSDESNDLSRTSIHSPFNKITFLGLKPELIGNIDITLTEMNSNIGMLTGKYILSIVDENNNKTFLGIKESYRVKKGDNRVVLLNFEREINEKFGEANGFLKNSVNLGIGSEDISYICNTAGDKLCFLNGSSLYLYNNSSGYLSHIYIARTDEKRKDLFSGYKIKLLGMSELGSVDFLLYGYIDRGEHEGMNGVILYHYDAELNTTIERLVITSDKTLCYLERELERLSYLKDDDRLYLCLSDRLYEIDLSSDGVAKKIIDGISDSRLVASYDNRYIAYGKNKCKILKDGYPISNLLPFQEIVIRDLHNGNEKTILAEKDQGIIPMGFLRNDLVYGVAKLKDANVDSYGTVIVPFGEVVVSNTDGNIVKTYKKKGRYINDIDLKDNIIELYRVKNSANGYAAISNDRIVYSGSADLKPIYTDKKALNNIGKALQLVLPNRVIDNEHRVSKNLIVADNNRRIVDIGTTNEADAYTVFSYGSIIGAYKSLSRAINIASANAAVVASNKHGSIWQRVDYNLEKIIDYDNLNENYLDYKNIQNIDFNGEAVLDLRGCLLDDVLYFIKQDMPVLARTTLKERVLIVGYDKYNLILRKYDKGKLSDEYYYGKNDSRILFEKSKNNFVCFLHNAE